MIRCKDCKYYNTKSAEVSVKYEHAYPVKDDPVKDEKKPRVPWGTLQSGLFSISMCQHPSCFEYATSASPVDGIVRERKRISGQGILNQKNDCTYFERKWWKVWL